MKNKGEYMITTKQRAYLRSLASTLSPTMQIGKEGIKETSIIQIEDMLDKNELVKIKVLKNCDEDIKQLANSIATKIGGECVQVIGSIFVLYRRSTRKGVKHIDLNI